MDELEGLAAWLAEGGARYDDLAMRRVGGRRAVFALRPIAAGAVIARVPRQLLLTRELARGSSIGRQLRDAGVELSGVHALHATWLLAERRDPGSPWRPYFDVLPRATPGFPIHASADERALLAGSLAGRLLDELRTDLDADLDKLQRVRLFRGFDRDDLTWARLCVGSRLFSLTIDGIETTALVPFADMLDHHPEPHTSWAYDQDAEAFTITARRGFAAGDEVCASYGNKGNSRLLVQYGFCLDANPHDEAELRFPERFRVPRDPAHASTRAMLAWLGQQHGGDDRARAALADAVRAAQAGFPTTIAADDALLARADLSAHARNFVRARRGEQEVLRAWLDFAGAARPG